MTDIALLILQWGLGLVFIWTGILIFRDVPGWAGIIDKSWVRGFLPSSRLTIRAVAVFDIVVGAWILTGIALWIPALLVALHLASVLLVTGIFTPAYRDVGLLAIAISLVLMYAPL